MNQREVVEHFKHLGWETKRADGGVSCRIELSDRIVQMSPRLKMLPDRQKLDLSPSVSTEQFSSHVSVISNEKSRIVPLVVNFTADPVVCSKGFSPKEIADVSQSVIDWATAQDLESGLQKYARLPSGSVGDLPLRHLAALAILGRRDALHAYKRSFAAGERAGFVPYITEDFIDRAIGLLRS